METLFVYNQGLKARSEQIHLTKQNEHLSQYDINRTSIQLLDVNKKQAEILQINPNVYAWLYIYSI